MIQVTVAPKQPNHPYYNKGSKFSYVFDGDEGKTLKLARGRTYVFNVNTVGHPLFFTASSVGGSDEGNLMNIDEPATDKGVTKFKVRDDLPTNFYYQCQIHPYMGGRVIIVDKEEESNLKHNTITPKLLYDGIVSPVGLEHAPNEPDYIYTLDQIGKIYRTNLTDHTHQTFLDITSYLPVLNPAYDERGLLGLAFHPEYNSNTVNKGRFFIFYSSRRYPKTETAKYYNCLSEFNFDHNNNKILYDQEKVMIRLPRQYNYHNGGKITFGPDGYLYLGIGDGGPQEDPNNNAQNLATPFGKILRIDVSKPGSFPKYYEIPSDNPFINTEGALNEIYAYGLRNPWGLSFDNRGRFFVTDAGYETKESIYLIVKGGNYGWNIKEGTTFTQFDNRDRSKEGLIDPIYEYNTVPGGSSVIIGGYFTNNSYLFGDFGGKIMRIIQDNNGNWSLVESTKINDYIKSFGQDGRNGKAAIYVLTSNNMGPSGLTGKIYLLNIN